MMAIALWVKVEGSRGTLVTASLEFRMSRSKPYKIEANERHLQQDA
jgi:hypothetical protein